MWLIVALHATQNKCEENEKRGELLRTLSERGEMTDSSSSCTGTSFTCDTICTESRVLFMVWNRIWALCFCFETFKCVTHTRLKLLFVVISRFIEMGKKCTRSISDTWSKGQRSIDLKCDYAYLEKTFPPLSISQHYCVAYCILTLWCMNMMNISRAYLSKMTIHLHINEFKQNKLFVSIKTTYESPEWETLTRKIQK